MKFILALVFATVHAIKLNSAQHEAEKISLAATDCPNIPVEDIILGGNSSTWGPGSGLAPETVTLLEDIEIKR